MSAFRSINTEAEHHRILAEMGVLDDMEDWKLFQEQERRFAQLDDSIDIDTWCKYVRIAST